MDCTPPSSAACWTRVIYSVGIESLGAWQYIWPLLGKIWSGISFHGLSHQSVKSSFCGCPVELLTLVSNSWCFHLSAAINMSHCWGETQSGIKFTAYKIWCPLYWFKYLSLIIYLKVYGIHEARMLLEMEVGGAAELQATAVCKSSSSPLTSISPSLASPDCYKRIKYDINAWANKQYVPQ